MWQPASTSRTAEGKAACKARCAGTWLAVKPNSMLIGMIGRLADQKGWDLVAS